ncbi:hypothetical protein AAZX31_10G099900 [Glycine max]
MGHCTCCLRSNKSGRWTMWCRRSLGQRCVHLIFGFLFSLRDVCVHPVFFLNIFLPNCIRLIISPSVESKLLVKFRENEIINLRSLLEGAIINQLHVRDIFLAKGFLFGQK